jgi:hypothetical protein
MSCASPAIKTIRIADSLELAQNYIITKGSQVGDVLDNVTLTPFLDPFFTDPFFIV